ncbi:MAG: cobalamin B12-binding domain-containing protein [Planctomycetota bacterium]|jgi:methylmalonyl-CoA mutase C-terminal domain/subunit
MSEGEYEAGDETGGAKSRIRVLISKCGLDGHDRGARVVARALRDHGFEVVYLGIHQTPEKVVAAAVEEDVDCIGVSMHSAAHMTIFPRILTLLEQHDAKDVLLVGGGVIPKSHVEQLKALGVGEIFLPGAPLATFCKYIEEEVRRRRPWRAQPGGSPAS